MSASPSQPFLDVGLALRDGWRAFQRAPWLFAGFALLLAALQVLLQSLQPDLTPETVRRLGSPSDWSTLLPALRDLTVTLGLLLFSSLLSVVVNLWGSCGMVRAAWVALSGARPRPHAFTRWDSRALLRLYLPGFLLGFGMALVVAVLVMLAAVLGRWNAWLALPPALALLAGTVYLSVSQAFLPQVALLHDDHAFEALAQGPRRVDPVWPSVVSLLLLNGALLVAGLCACGVGLVVAIPLVTCVSTAAYRQVFGPEDRTGLTRALPEMGGLRERGL